MRYEYFVKDLQLGGNIPVVSLQEQLNQIGRDRWELVSSFERDNNFRCYLFKRPVKEA